MTADEEPRRGITRQMNDLNNDIALAMGRFDEALDLLATWADEYPDDGLARMSLNLIRRTQDTGGPSDD